MTQRILSTLALWVVILFMLLFLGLQAGLWLLALAVVLTQHELYRMMRKIDYTPYHYTGIVWGVLIILAPYYIAQHSSISVLEAGSELLVFSIFYCCLMTAFREKTSNALKKLMPTLFGIVYVPYMMQFLVALTQISEIEIHGVMLAVWVIAVAKFTDVGGLLVGMKFGKHKMSPERSPKKTWEGAFGGIAIAIIIGLLLRVALPDYFPPRFSLLYAGIIAIPIAIISIGSDLIESTIKRETGVKDSGTKIPGIGGAFDLTDSIVLCAPLGYYIFRFTLYL